MVLIRFAQLAVQLIVLVVTIATTVRALQFSRDEYRAAHRPPWIRVMLGVATPS
ncbi:hypothetical protein AB0M36_05780 [Actinoplanes sp. NPDC051346]|uniref:hypothetical protein n=1 Tax=Actinoplanes sp. NPDC051346 TaxID=3155048 RepID=UPI003434EF96